MRRAFYTVECRECGTIGYPAYASSARGREAIIGRMSVESGMKEEALRHDALRHARTPMSSVVRWDAASIWSLRVKE